MTVCSRPECIQNLPISRLIVDLQSTIHPQTPQRCVWFSEYLPERKPPASGLQHNKPMLRSWKMFPLQIPNDQIVLSLQRDESRAILVIAILSSPCQMINRGIRDPDKTNFPADLAWSVCRISGKGVRDRNPMQQIDVIGL